jgi:hypothetical protein
LQGEIQQRVQELFADIAEQYDITREDMEVSPDGFDHGAGHPLLFLDDTKVPNHRKNNGFKGLGNYSEWPKVAGTMIQAVQTMSISFAPSRPATRLRKSSRGSRA